MPINRPPTESQPRPPKAVDVLQATETEPESDSLFDPNRDISKETENVMFKELEYFRQIEDWWSFSEMAMHLSILYPDRKADLGLSKNEFNEIKAALDACRPSASWNFMQIATSLLILYPDCRSELNLNDRLLGKIINNVNRDTGGNDWILEWLRENFGLSIMFPKCYKGFGKENDSRFDDLVVQLGYRRVVNGWGSFLSYAQYLSILFPSRKAELKLTSEDFDEMKAELHDCRRHRDLLEFSSMAMGLTILSAERAQITPDGQIKLTHKPGTLVKPRKPLPERSRVCKHGS